MFCAIPVSIAGCQIPAQMRAAAHGEPQYERASIVYDLDGRIRPLPLTLDALQPVSHEESLAAATSTDWKKATLSVQYPGPDGDLTRARATLRLSAQASAPVSAFKAASGWLGLNRHPDEASPDMESKKDDELWVLDLPKEELDLLLTDLQQGGFFESQTRSESGTELDVHLNWGHVKKEWSPEPRLDHFFSRVYREGRLEGLVAADTPSVSNRAIAGR